MYSLTYGQNKKENSTITDSKDQLFRVFKNFSVDPLMTGWMNNGSLATRIRDQKEFEKFNSHLKNFPSYENRFKKEIAKYKVDFAKEGMAFVRYGYGHGDVIYVDETYFKDGVLTVKVSHKYEGPAGPRKAIAILGCVGVAFKQGKVDKVIFELPGNKKAEAIINKK